MKIVITIEVDPQNSVILEDVPEPTASGKTYSGPDLEDVSEKKTSKSDPVDQAMDQALNLGFKIWDRFFSDTPSR